MAENQYFQSWASITCSSQQREVTDIYQSDIRIDQSESIAKAGVISLFIQWTKFFFLVEEQK